MYFDVYSGIPYSGLKENPIPSILFVYILPLKSGDLTNKDTFFSSKCVQSGDFRSIFVYTRPSSQGWAPECPIICLYFTCWVQVPSFLYFLYDYLSYIVCTCSVLYTCIIFIYVHVHVCTVHNIDNHKRSLTHHPSSQGWAHRCPIRVCVFVLFRYGVLGLGFLSLRLIYLVCYTHIFSCIIIYF